MRHQALMQTKITNVSSRYCAWELLQTRVVAQPRLVTKPGSRMLVSWAQQRALIHGGINAQAMKASTMTHQAVVSPSLGGTTQVEVMTSAERVPVQRPCVSRSTSAVQISHRLRPARLLPTCHRDRPSARALAR